MANVDYNEYVRQYGQSLDLSGLQKGIDTFMKNRKEAIVHKAKELSNKTYSAMVKPWEDTIAGDVSEEGWALKASNLANKTPGQALKEYQDAAKLKGDKVYNQLLSSGAFDPKIFKENYKANIATYMPELEMKLESYQKNNHLTDDEMKEYIKDNNLTKLLQKHGSDEGALRAMTYGDETYKEWWAKKPLYEKAMIGGSPYAAYQTYKLGKDLIAGRGPKGRWGGGGKKALGLTEKGKTGAIKALGWEGKTTKAGKIAMKKATSSQSAATRALNQAKKLGKSKKVIAGLQKTKDAAIVASKASKVGAAAGPMNTITSYISKNGTSALIKKVVAKVGYRGAAKFLGRGALSLGLKGTGIGAAASFALDASTVWWLASIIKDFRE